MYNTHKHFYDIPQIPKETLSGYRIINNGHLGNHGSIPKWG